MVRINSAGKSERDDEAMGDFEGWVMLMVG